MGSLPHGGRLVERTASGEEKAKMIAAARRDGTLVLSRAALSDLMLLGTGAYSPLEGFMDAATYQSVVERMRLPSGLVWPLPVTLPVTAVEAARIREGAMVLLTTGDGRPAGILEPSGVFTIDKGHEAALVFGTDDPAHPGVARLFSGPEYRVGGSVRYFPDESAEKDSLLLTPRQTRALFASLGWQRIVAFQTRNPIHRAHEYIQKCALETVDGLLLHPLAGETKGDDLPIAVRLRSYEVLLERYFPKSRVVLSLFPAYMRYAGPREALFPALCRKNSGCTHFIVGRDHAGGGNYYGTYDAQRIFARFSEEELGITPLLFENAFYCRKCEQMASSKTCPHGEEEHVGLSGTTVRRMLHAGQAPPPELTRPEVAEVLIESLTRA